MQQLVAIAQYWRPVPETKNRRYNTTYHKETGYRVPNPHCANFYLLAANSKRLSQHSTAVVSLALGLSSCQQIRHGVKRGRNHEQGRAEGTELAVKGVVGFTKCHH